jgi:hypothetical protein
VKLKKIVADEQINLRLKGGGLKYIIEILDSMVALINYNRRDGENEGIHTSESPCLSCKMLEIILRRAEFGENPSHGGTYISFVHWIGVRLLLSLSHQAVPNDHHLIINPFSENATRP